MISRLRRALGFDQLTYPGIFRLVLLVLGGALLLSAARLQMGWGVDMLERARGLYLGRGLAAGERFLSEYLADRPEEAEGFILLARTRGRFERMAVQESQQVAALAGDSFRGPESSAGRFPRGYLDRHLSEEDFGVFLKKSRAVDPLLLGLYREGERTGPEAVARGVAEVVAQLKSGAKSEADLVRHLARTGDLCDKYRLQVPALGYYTAALDASREVSAREAGESDEIARQVRRAMLSMLLASKNTAELETLLARSDFQAAADPSLLYRFHLERGEYMRMTLPLMRSQLEAALQGEWLGALVVGAGWLLFLLHMGRVLDRGPRLIVPAALALVLGMMSALATLWVVIVQEHLFGAAGDGRGIVFNLFNAVFGIGLREELIKLVFAIPLALFLRRESDPLKIFALTSLVGLGFAVAENINYYVYGGGTVVARFLTANFLHMTLTGYAGYYFVRASQGKDKWETFSESFFLMVLCHGLYDFFLIEPAFGELSFLAYIVYIWIAQKYLRLLVSLRHRKPGEASLTQMFILALVLAVGVAIWQLARTVGFLEGFFQLAQALLGVGIILIMFFREFDEPVS